MDIAKAFSFVFEDKDWVVKVLIAVGIFLGGILLSILIIPAILAWLLLGGYSLEITRRVIRGQSPALPAWEDWGKLIVDGLQVLLIGIVYALPIILFSLCFGIPVGVLSENSSDGLAAVLSSGLGCLNFLWGIVMSFLLPAALGIFADTGDLGAAFRFGDVFALVRDKFTTYLILAIISWAVYTVGGILGIIVCGLGWLFTIPYAEMVIGHLTGQAYVEAKGLSPAVEAAVVDES
jgi:hypothetical protein